jgi:hypothetical protein
MDEGGHGRGGAAVLVELAVVEQPFAAVHEVLDGMPLTEAASREGSDPWIVGPPLAGASFTMTPIPASRVRCSAGRRSVRAN